MITLQSNEAHTNTSDTSTNVEELKTLVRQFCEDRDWDQFHNPKELAIGLSTEAAELLEHFRFQSPEQILEKMRTPATREAISCELADVLFFLLRFSQMEHIDLSDALRHKMEISAKKYPIQLSKGKNLKYTELNK